MSDLFTTIVSSPVAKKGRACPSRPGCAATSPVCRCARGRCSSPAAVASPTASPPGSAAGVATVSHACPTRATRSVPSCSTSAPPSDPAELDQLRLLGAPAVKALKRNGRVVVIGTDPATLTDVAEVTTQRALEGAVRSIGKELRAGARRTSFSRRGRADGVRSAVEFFLSGRSAYVDGQVVRVDESTSGDVDALRPLEGKVAVVTGAARGIGAEIARVLARDGATVVAVDVPVGRGRAGRGGQRGGGHRAPARRHGRDAGRRIVEHATTRHGGLDIVVHNAGITRDKLFVNMDDDRWRSVMEVNLRSVLRMNEAILGEGGLSDGGRTRALPSTGGLRSPPATARRLRSPRAAT